MKTGSGQAIDGVLSIGDHVMLRNSQGWYGDPQKIPFVTERGEGASLKDLLSGCRISRRRSSDVLTPLSIISTCDKSGFSRVWVFWLWPFALPRPSAADDVRKPGISTTGA